MKSELFYFHDPMCSWCWAFKPVWSDLRQQLPIGLNVRSVVGGLAPDNHEPMHPDMRIKLMDVWKSIQTHVPDTRFNFDFWKQCTPRRSTYSSCRAVLAATRLSLAHEELMIQAIQKAYYLDARNPSEIATLMDLAEEIGLDRRRFADELTGAAVEKELQTQVAFARMAPINGFPALAMRTTAGLSPIATDYLNAAPMRAQIEKILLMNPRTNPFI